jgi:hypothetical protein
MSPSYARPLLVALLGATAACDRAPVVWNDAAERRALVSSDSTVSVTPDAAIDSVLRATLRAVLHVEPPGASSVAPVVPGAVLNGVGTGCLTSVRVSAGRGDARDAVWWSLRPNGSALLLASHSSDGGLSWAAPVHVDTLDTGSSGCDRPAPAIATDTSNGYVHVAYSLAAPEGTGVFYAHRMGPTLPFEAPQVIVYGDHVTHASVASNGDLVAVAYEDPNASARPYVSLALSHTAGHSWAERFVVSSDVEAAEHPEVAVRGRDVAVGWLVPNAPRTLDDADAPPSPSHGGMVVVRVGRLR